MEIVRMKNEKTRSSAYKFSYVIVEVNMSGYTT